MPSTSPNVAVPTSVSVGGAGLGEHADGVAERPALVVDGGLVERRPRRRPRGAWPVGEVERVEPLVVDPVGADRARRGRRWLTSPSAPTSWAKPWIEPAAASTPSTARTARRVSASTRSRTSADVAVDAGRAVHDDVDALVGGGEQLVEGLPHGVGEDHRPRHEGHAEDDGEAGEHEAHLVGPEALECEAQHSSIVSVAGHGFVGRRSLLRRRPPYASQTYRRVILAMVSVNRRDVARADRGRRLRRDVHRVPPAAGRAQGVVRVTVVDPRSVMTYQPFLPEAAAGTLEPRHVVVPLRQSLEGCR